MQPTILEQTMVFLRAFGAGAVIAAVYIIIACVRAVSKPDKILLFFEDLLFSLFAGAVSFIFSLGTSGGQLRGYTIVAELTAFFALYLTLGKLLVRSADRISRMICSFVNWIISPVKKSLGKIISAITAKLNKIYRKMHKNLKKIKI